MGNLLSSLEINKREISNLAISTGPGSFTGLRIGIATILGLSAALNIPAIGVPLFETMIAAVDSVDDCTAAVPLGRNDIAWQRFSRVAPGSAMSTPASEFTDALAQTNSTTIIIHPGVLALVPDLDRQCHTIHNVGENLASLIAKGIKLGSPNLTQPMYLSSSGFRK